MRHPFDGVNSAAEAAQDGGQTRRTALGQMAVGAASLLGLASAARAGITTDALGEEGGPGVPTRVAGEEGRPAAVTTEPFGEEAGKVVSRAEPGVEDGGKSATATADIGEDGGPVATTLALGEEGGGLRVTSRGLGEEGGLTRRRGEDGGPAPIVPVRPDTIDLDDRSLDQTWSRLADQDATQAVQACAILYGAKNVVPFLEKKLTSTNFTVPEVDDKTVSRLIADLDNDASQARERATRELEKLAPAVVDRLEKALNTATSPEQRMRLTRLVAAARTRSVQAQGRRGLEVLVALRSPAARKVLEALAKGPEKEWLTRIAKEALPRVR